MRCGYEQFRGGATLNTKVQKNDQLRSGCGKRFGRSVNPSLDVVVLAFTTAAGLVRDPRCRKDQDRSKDCLFCPPLLPLKRGRRSVRAQTVSYVSADFSHDSQSAWSRRDGYFSLFWRICSEGRSFDSKRSRSAATYPLDAERACSEPGSSSLII